MILARDCSSAACWRHFPRKATLARAPAVCSRIPLPLFCPCLQSPWEAFAATSDRLHYFHCDVTKDMPEVDAVAAATLPSGASIWFLNAGALARESFMHLTPASLLRGAAWKSPRCEVLLFHPSASLRLQV